jgi:predicted DNA-binding transcriptional regulator AlpA
MQLLKLKEALIFFGGINASTLYRGIKLGRYPAPVKVGPQSSRWLLEECEAALQAMIEVRS